MEKIKGENKKIIVKFVPNSENDDGGKIWRRGKKTKFRAKVCTLQTPVHTSLYWNISRPLHYIKVRNMISKVLLQKSFLQKNILSSNEGKII